MDKNSGKERWLPLPRRHETNIHFECGRENLFLFGGKKNEFLYDSEWIYKKWQQKAFIVEVAGCIEHSTLIFEALREAKEEYRSICLAMLDFANAYG